MEKKGGRLFVGLEENGSKRLLYLDTLKAIAKEKDRQPLALLIKMHLRMNRPSDTLTFEKIEVPPLYAEEAFRLIHQTGRMVCKEEPRIEQKIEVFPCLVLKDGYGCFADLWMDYGIGEVEFSDFIPTIEGRPRMKKEEGQWEKDLLEAGYQKKQVGDSSYYCPKEKLKDALLLLLDVGWKIRNKEGKILGKQIEIQEEKGKISIRGEIRGLIDLKLQMEGVWEGEALVLKKNQIGLLCSLGQESHISWEKSLWRLVEGLKSGACLEEAPPSLSFRGTLLPFQQKGVDWLNFLYRWGFSGLLADEMGLGKTVQVLAFLSRLGTNLPILIVAPTSLLFNWRSEIDRFLTEGGHFVLISYTALRLNQEQYAQTEFGAIVLDESNAIKTASTQTARAAYRLKSRFKVCLSGTPMENRPDEIWSQFHFLMPDLIERKEETLKQQIRPFILRRRKEEVQLDLPEKVEQLTWIEMTEEQKEVYEAYRKGICLQGAGKMQVLEAILRLRQIASDPRLVGSPIPGAKIQRLIADVEEALEQKRKILVFSQFTSMLQLIRQEFKEALYLDGSMGGVERGQVVRAFQEEKERSLFLLSLKAGGVGLNLTAADYVFLVDPWWNEAVERQAIDRVHRIGQKKTVFAKRYATLASVEEKMLQLKSQKQQAADQLLDFQEEALSESDLFSLLA